MASWKFRPEASDAQIEYTPLLNAKKFFAVDDSGSTSGTIIRREKEFVQEIFRHQTDPVDSISLWGSDCDTPVRNIESIRWTGGHGGTEPTTILNHPGALRTLQESDVWFLLTDGEIWDGEVQRLSQRAPAEGIANIPVVFVITGSQGKTPNSTNISVVISFYANCPDALILFKRSNSGQLWVIAAKGVFSGLAGSATTLEVSSWDDLQTFRDEAELIKHWDELNIEVAKAASRPEQVKGVSLGAEWEAAHGGPMYIDLDLLLKVGKLPDNDAAELFAEEAFRNLAVAYKTRMQIPDLRAWVQQQKIEQIAPKLEDVAGAAAIITELGGSDVTDAQRAELQQRLRDAHAKNRENYQDHVNNFANSPEAQAVRKRNQLVDAAFRTLAEIDAAGFTADILSRKSNRARRAEIVTADSTQISYAKLDFQADSFKGHCFICCGETEIMSIALRALDHEITSENTGDFALNFPLAAGAFDRNISIVASQNICFQCALANEGKSMYNEEVSAVIPTVEYDGDNKEWIREQLYLGLTAGLRTGAAGVAQLFMAILSQVLKTKEWAGSDVGQKQPPDVIQRRKTFDWMLEQLLKNTYTRETFSEDGKWVPFGEALRWVSKDFEDNGLASFAVTYPVAGYKILIGLGQRVGAFCQQQAARMNVCKIIYSVTAAYLADLLKEGRNDLQWQQKYLALIYKDFNGPLAPKDLLGPESILSDLDAFWAMASPFGPGDLHATLDVQTEQHIMHKIQILLFWLIFHQKHHVTAQNYFKSLRNREQLAIAVLSPDISVPEKDHAALLLSIFVERTNLLHPELQDIHTDIAPFVTPFGPSVTHCAFPRCGKTFLSADFDTTQHPIPEKEIEAIRQNRRLHLIEAFGIRNRFERNSTGLPEVTTLPKPPPCWHINMHVSIARAWDELSKEARRAAVVADSDAQNAFVQAAFEKAIASGRGDIFQADLESKIRAVLPSFFAALKAALMLKGGRDGKGDGGIEEFEYDWEREAALDKKVAHELRVRAMGLVGGREGGEDKVLPIR